MIFSTYSELLCTTCSLNRAGSYYYYWKGLGYSLFHMLSCQQLGSLVVIGRWNLWEVLACSGGCWVLLTWEIMCEVRHVLIWPQSHIVIRPPPSEAVRLPLWWVELMLVPSCTITFACDSVWMLETGTGHFWSWHHCEWPKPTTTKKWYFPSLQIHIIFFL